MAMALIRCSLHLNIPLKDVFWIANRDLLYIKLFPIISGASTGDTYGPRYVLENDGHVRLAGRLNDVQSNALTTVVMEQLKKSLLVQKIT